MKSHLQPTGGLAKKLVDENNISKLYLSTSVPAGRYKLGNRINNELLIINLASVQADKFQMPILCQAPKHWLLYFTHRLLDF
ncbi:MAG: hypothetical protein ACOYVG_12660 [Bacteroidota bacterium]